MLSKNGGVKVSFQLRRYLSFILAYWENLSSRALVFRVFLHINWTLI